MNGRGAICGSILAASIAAVSSAHDDVYRIDVTDLKGSGRVRKLTGFRVKEWDGIVTSLHGLADPRSHILITVTSGNRTPKTLFAELSMVDVPHDLALLSVKDAGQLAPSKLSRSVSGPLAPRTQVRLIGYPLGITREDLTVPLTIGEPAYPKLASLVSNSTRFALQQRQSPSPEIQVISLVGFIHPGHSGAPVISKQGAVIGVAGGGLERNSGIGWAIPLSDVRWEAAERNHQLVRLQSDQNGSLYGFRELLDQNHDLEQLVRQVVREYQSGGWNADVEAPSPTGPASPRVAGNEGPYALALRKILSRRWDEASSLLTRAEETGDADEAQIAEARGNIDYLTGQYTTAANSFRRLVALRAQPDALNLLASALWKGGQTTEAEQYFRKVVELRRRNGNTKPFALASALNNLAVLCLDDCRSGEAAAILREALAIYAVRPDERRVGAAIAACNLGMAYSAGGRHADAERELKQAIIELTAATAHRNRPLHLATAKAALAELYCEQGKYDEAKVLAEAAYETRLTIVGPEDLSTAKSFHTLGNVQKGLRNWKQAEEAFTKALGIRDRVLGDHPETASILSDLGSLYLDRRRFALAEPMMLRALAIRRKTLRPNHPHTATSLNNLGELYSETGRLTEAEANLSEALTIRRQVFGVCLATAVTLNNLGLVKEQRKELSAAEAYLREALAIKERTLPPKHLSLATGLINLGKLLAGLHNYDEALPMLKRGLSIRTSVLGPKNGATLAAKRVLDDASGKQSNALEIEQVTDHVDKSK